MAIIPLSCIMLDHTYCGRNLNEEQKHRVYYFLHPMGAKNIFLHIVITFLVTKKEKEKHFLSFVNRILGQSN